MRIKTAYRLHVCEKLYSFDDSIDKVPVCNTPLSQWQDEAFQSRGISVEDIDDMSQVTEEHSILFDNNLYFTKEFVAQAVDRAEASTEPLRFCLGQNTFNQQFVLPFGDTDTGLREFNFFYNIKDNGGCAYYRNTVLQQRLYEYSVSLPRELVQSREFHFDLCDTFATAVISPFHLLQTNLAVLAYRCIPFPSMFPRWLTKRFTRVGSRPFYFLLRRQNRIGKRCRIHKTAIIEGSVIEDDVTLGAYSVVRISRIGNGSTLEDHATVHYSVLGNNNYIAAHNHIYHCMTYNDVFLIHGPYGFSILGKNSCVFATLNCDVRLDKKTIAIPTEKGILDSGRSLLGIAYGHDTKVGAGTIIAPGRIVPNGKHIDPPASIILNPNCC